MAYHAMVAEHMHHTNEMIARPLGMFLLHSIKILRFENVVSDREARDIKHKNHTNT